MNTKTSGVIYGLHDMDNVIRYVGYTTQRPAERLRQHRSDSRSGKDRAVHRWMRKHGEDNIQMQILEQVAAPNSETLQILLNSFETLYISDMKANGFSLLNGTGGGDGVVDPSAETRAKQREAKLGKPSTRVGFTHTEETKRRMSLNAAGTLNHRYGTTHTPETIAKMSASKTGKMHTPESKAKMSVSAKGPRRGLHVRWHSNRGIIEPSCQFCMV